MTTPAEPSCAPAECALLGRSLLSEHDFPEAVASLPPSAWSDPGRAAVAGAITALVEAGEPVCSASVLIHLQRRGDAAWLPFAPAVELVGDLVASAPLVGTASYYAGAIREAAVRRELWKIASRLADSASAAGTTALRDLLAGVVELAAELREAS